MSTESTFKQDLPPKGGYRKLDFSRIPAKKIWNWWTIIPAYIGLTAFGLYLYKKDLKQLQREKLENSSAYFAMGPLLAAEKDRLLLKNLRRLRDEERELMKNVNGWEVGTLFGEPIYKTIPDDEFVLPLLNEYFGHTDKPSTYADYSANFINYY